MSLAEHLRIGTPLVWLTTNEPERFTDFVRMNADRDVFRMDAFKGFSKWNGKKWVQVLVEIDNSMTGETEITVTHDLAVAFHHVVENKGLFILTNAHIYAEKLIMLLAGIYEGYRRTFNDNDKTELPAQLILMSYSEEVPPEIAKHVAHVTPSVPGPEEIASLLAHIKAETPDFEVFPADSDLSPLVRSVLGMSEPEIMQGCMLSLREKEVLDSEWLVEFKRNKIKEGGILEIVRPKLDLNDIGGLDLAKELIENAVWAWQNPQEAQEYGITPLRRLLMVGVPGSGKSAICEGTAKTLKLDLAKFGVSKMLSKWVGQSEQNMRIAFQQIRALAPICCWMDELGRDLSGSGVANDSGTTDRVHGEFLTGLQELPDNVFLMGAANRIEGLPPEMLRADRFDKIMFVGYPTTEERVDIFRIHLGERADEFNLENLAEVTPMFTGAEIKALIKETRFKVGSAERRHITTEDILGIVPNQKNRVWLKHKGAIIEMYRRALEEWEWASSGQLADASAILNGTIGGSKGNMVLKKF